MADGLKPAPGQPGSDQLPFMAAFGDWRLIDCGCASDPFARKDRHRRACLRWRADAQRAEELIKALRPEDIRWLNNQGWDGRL